MARSLTSNCEEILLEGVKKADSAVKLGDFCGVKLLGIVGIAKCTGGEGM